MIELLRDMLHPEASKKLNTAESSEAMADFATWIAIFGSDQAVVTYRN